MFITSQDRSANRIRMKVCTAHHLLCFAFASNERISYFLAIAIFVLHNNLFVLFFFSILENWRFALVIVSTLRKRCTLFENQAFLFSIVHRIQMREKKKTKTKNYRRLISFEWNKKLQSKSINFHHITVYDSVYGREIL